MTAILMEPVVAPHEDVAPGLVPFDARTLTFTTALSRALAGDAALRRDGAVQALAFWLRPTELRRLEQQFRALEQHDSVLVPRGTVFHIPPSNVDTLFIYSLVLALLCGNRNVVRLSDRLSGIGLRVATLTQTLLADPAHADVAAQIAFVTYGHDAAQTVAFSAACDVRVLWGGDAAVTTLRAAPLPPHAVELVFPDRYSGCVLHAQAVRALSSTERDALADRFANDAFWFDQHACSSPRLVAWIGDESVLADVAADFWERVGAAATRRGVRIDAGTSLAKLTAAAGCAIDEAVSHVTWVTPEVTVVTLRSLEAFGRVAPGGGLFHQLAIHSLAALAPQCTRRDQTLTVFGVPRDEIVAAARLFNGRGVDRLVPVGQALAFSHHWDGYDLLQQFTRRVSIPVAGW
jgi:hypothetical protein